MTRVSLRVDRVLWIACPVLMFVVMFAHMTAIENILLGLIGVGVIAAAISREQPSPAQWPLVIPILLWGAWSLASVAWSPFPDESVRSWLDEVLYPLVTFIAFWLVGRQSARPERLVLINWIACALLAITSIVHWGQLQPPTADTFLLHYYNRVGHTSTLVIFAMPLFTGLTMHGRWRIVGVSGLVLCFFVGLATLNRFFWPAAGLAIIVALFPMYRRHLLLAAMVILLTGVAAVGTLELSTRMRNGHPIPAAGEVVHLGQEKVHVPNFVAGIVATVSGDTRPRLWNFYLEAGRAHAWTGVGFGKPLPGRVYKAGIPAQFLSVEPQALTHAHNVVLNTWLETGLIGVVFEVALWVALVARFYRLRHATPWISAAGVALVVGMLAKNSTDDLMWQTTALAFWGFAGLLLGRGERMSGSSDASARG
jgi:O-Antigen ligase